MSNIDRNTKKPPPFRLDPREFPTLAHSPAALDLGATNTLVNRLSRSLYRLRRRSSLHTRTDAVDAAIEIIKTELPRVAAELAEPADLDAWPGGAA